ncbi:MAG: T9SS type A sorting domain-containing protein [Flavobacterium sp.]|nr:T9SS type A sorting domain-containing protein [Flavobacterium sp.]
MKKITLLFILIGTLCSVNAQVLNQNAGWPNTAWTLTGSYLATGVQSDPSSTSNFAFDDDITGIGHEDNIAAESPIIDLTAAFSAGETWLTVSAPYVYRYLADDELVFQYWNADSATWINWGTNFDALGNYTTDKNYCSGNPSTYTSSILNIAGFSSTQLSGFKYRISYDDNPAGTDWNYGFCFQSPTIVSSIPPACPSPSSLAALVTTISATLSWIENGSASLYNVEYGTNGFTQGTGTLLSGISNSYNLTLLTPATAYSYYVQAACGGTAGTSTWSGPFSFTTPVPTPENDDCSGAFEMTFDYTNTQNAVAATNNAGFITSCSVTASGMNDGVWYTFLGNGGDITIALSAVGPWDPQLDIYSGTCGSFTCEASADSGLSGGAETLTVIGTTSALRYYVNVGYYSTITDRPEGLFTITATSSLANSSFDNSNFTYYPNPVKNTLNLSYNQEISNVDVFNLMGQKLSSQTINANQGQVGMTNLSNGVYLVKVTSYNQVKTLRIIKE